LKAEYEKVRNTIGIDDFLSRTQVAQQLRERIDKWDYMKFLTIFVIFIPRHRAVFYTMPISFPIYSVGVKKIGGDK
jgi:hypothetical protein